MPHIKRIIPEPFNSVRIEPVKGIIREGLNRKSSHCSYVVIFLTDVIEAMSKFMRQDYANSSKVHGSVYMNKGKSVE